MNPDPDFTRIIDLALERQSQLAADQEQDARSEEQRIQLNLGKVRYALDDIVLPIFQQAAAALNSRGCFAQVEETRVNPANIKRVALIVSLSAGLPVTQGPQSYKTLSYEGDPATLAFVRKTPDTKLSLGLPQITTEAVTAEISKFLQTYL